MPRRRPLVAALALVAAVVIVGIVVPVLAVREARGEDDGLVPSSPFLLTLSALTIAAALLAFYRLATERLHRLPDAGEPRDSPEPTPRETDAAPAAIEAPSRAGRAVSSSAPGRSAPARGVPRQTKRRGVESDRAAPVPAVDEPEGGRRRGRRPAHPAGAERAVPAPDERRTLDDRAAADPGRRNANAIRRRQDPRKQATTRAEPHVKTSTENDGADDARAVVETCEIVWWHGAWKGAFDARLTGGGGRGRVVLRSPLVPWRAPTPPPPDHAAANAHRLLVKELERLGWKQEERGSTWYGMRLRRVATSQAPRSARRSMRARR